LPISEQYQMSSGCREVCHESGVLVVVGVPRYDAFAVTFTLEQRDFVIGTGTACTRGMRRQRL
jgi:cysteine sulfinate desulfinase/cysteine desulfurase-like protein